MPKRKYEGPLQPGKRSARVARAPKALATKRRKPNYQASLKLTKPFRTVLDSYLTRRDVKHWVQRNYATRQLANVPTTGAHLIPVLPNIDQAGAPPNQDPNSVATREGNFVRLKTISLDLRMYIPADDLAYSADRASIEVIVAVLSSKTYKTFAEVVNNWDVGEQINTMLMQYDDTPSPYFGRPDSNLLPFNTQAFTVHDQRRFYMNRGMIINDSAVPTPGATGAGHMPFLTKRLRMHIKCKGKVLKYASPEEPLPTNFGPFLWIGFAYTNNAVATTAGVPFMYGRTVARFEDCG